MRISIETKVSQNAQEVWAGFNQDLFLALNPPFPKAKLLRFDGSTTNDEVHLEIDFILFKSEWKSLITAHGESEEEIFLYR